MSRNNSGIYARKEGAGLHYRHEMEIIDNINTLLGDDLKKILRPNVKLKIAASCFSIYAYEALKTELEQIDSLNFIFTSPTFIPNQVTDKLNKEKREFHIPKLKRESSLYGSEFEIRLKNELTQRAIAKECAEWIQRKIRFRSNRSNAPMQQFACVEDDQTKIAYLPLTGFTAVELGYQRGDAVSNFVNKLTDPAMTTTYLRLFDQIWHDHDKNGNRKFIMVQLPEPCDEKSEAFKAGYKTIAEIGKERIRRAGKRIKDEWIAKQPTLYDDPSAQNAPDIGFRVFKVDTSNMKDVYYTPDELKQDNLELFKDHIKSDRRPEDLLFQVFLDWGLDLTKPIAKETIDGKTVFIVDTNDLLACFDSGITEELVKKLAKHKPLRAVFRDDAFGSDSVKINVEQIFKLLSPGTEVKTL